MIHYKNSFRNAWMALLCGAMLCVSCKEDEPKSAACDIMTFSVNSEEWEIDGTNVTHAYPVEMGGSPLTPAITLSPGATVNPPSGEEQNFFTAEGITYTVTAEDGATTKTYAVKATSNMLTVSVENGTSYNDQIDLVKADIEIDDETEIITLVSAPYTGGGFTMTLPASVSDRYLSSVFDEIPTGVTVSDPQVKSCTVSLEAYKSEINTGYFYHGAGNWGGEAIYVDGNVTITGSYIQTETYGETTLTYTHTYDMHLSRGWNMVYDKLTEEGHSFKYEVTTQVPAGAKWVFYDYPPITPRSLHKRASSRPSKRLMK
ncbi:MAG: hypothetical protein LBM08_05550 [Dysgonamonadaceae bacterium]|jgi:hypothetical protein|nr:hypothetical protein [Dysgonamonadaceae bacterium]